MEHKIGTDLSFINAKKALKKLHMFLFLITQFLFSSSMYAKTRYSNSSVASPKFWKGRNILTLGEQQYLLGTPPLKAQNDKIC